MTARRFRAADYQSEIATWQLVGTIVGSILLLLTLWQTKLAAGAAVSAANEAKTANQIAQDTANQQLRAYVLIEGIVLSKDPLDGNRIGAVVNAKNYGQTPARSLTEWASIRIAGVPLSEELPPFAAPNASVSILAPGQLSIQIPTDDRPSEIMAQSIIDGNTAIYVYGQIAYTDAFRCKRTTEYRHMCTGQGFALGLFRQCPDGNYYS